MKKLILTLSALVCSTQAYALSPNSSWDEILTTPSVKAAFSQIVFGNVFVSIPGVCSQGDDLRTVEKISRCVEWKSEGENTSCVRHVKEFLTTPRVFTAERCVEWSAGEGSECARKESYTAAHALSYDVNVYKLVDQGENVGEELLFTKRFDIEACSGK